MAVRMIDRLRSSSRREASVWRSNLYCSTTDRRGRSWDIWPFNSCGCTKDGNKNKWCTLMWLIQCRIYFLSVFGEVGWSKATVVTEWDFSFVDEVQACSNGGRPWGWLKVLSIHLVMFLSILTPPSCCLWPGNRLSEAEEASAGTTSGHDFYSMAPALWCERVQGLVSWSDRKQQEEQLGGCGNSIIVILMLD